MGRSRPHYSKEGRAPRRRAGNLLHGVDAAVYAPEDTLSVGTIQPPHLFDSGSLRAPSPRPDAGDGGEDGEESRDRF